MYRAAVTTRDFVSVHGEKFQSSSDVLIEKLSDLGFNSILISPYLNLNALDDFGLDLILLHGGESIGLNYQRDLFEEQLLKKAIDRQIPVLGICRGMQLINCFFGGTLRRIDGHVGTIHEVEGNFRGKTNSFHEWAIDSIGQNLVIEAISTDGNIEAVSSQDCSVLGVMWHPERANCDVKLEELIIRLDVTM